MESTTKKIILPTAGIANTTPDQICEDTELLDATGLTYVNDALRPIQKNVVTSSSLVGSTVTNLKYVHRINDGITVNYISTNAYILYSNGSKIQEFSKTITSVNAVGNTLIVSFGNSAPVYYILWKNGAYTPLGDAIPDFSISYKLNQTYEYKKSYISVSGYGYDIIGIDEQSESSSSTWHHIGVENGKTDDAINLITGTYAGLKKEVARKKRFFLPFFAVATIELYDGSYIKQTNPVLLFPCVHRNVIMADAKVNSKDTLVIEAFTSALRFQLVSDYADWKDIVRGINIFISDFIELNQTDLEGTLTSAITYIPKTWEDEDNPRCDTISTSGPGTTTQIDYPYYHKCDYWNVSKDHTSITCAPFPLRSETEILADMVSTRVFYKLAELPLDIDTSGTGFLPTPSSDGFLLIDNYIKSGVIENITTQEQLTLDYYSHCKFNPLYTATFNRRLNLARVKRSFFEGFTHFCALGSATKHNYKITVTISTPESEKKIVNQFVTAEILPFWFYYPDPRASHVTIYSGTTKLLDTDLIEHRGLNGAYYMANALPNETNIATLSANLDTSTTAYTDTDTPEILNNYLLQSEVDNPFTFNASGYVRVGQGTILAMAGLTTGLTQDAYKVSTTLVFTTQGIWAVTINDDGTYKTVSPPFSREVLYNYYDSKSSQLVISNICTIDNGVFFISKKGLMLITDDGVKCVSSHLAGKNPSSKIYSTILGDDTAYTDFLTFLYTSQMAYDYRDSQLIITNTAYSYHWVYNIATATFTRYDDGYVYNNIVADYPDTLMQDSLGGIHSLASKPDINHDTLASVQNTYSATLITRPLKFSESIHLKTIREIQHITDLNDNATIKIQIFASNDCRTWKEIESLHGRGFKYFIFKYTFTNLIATDSFAGTLVGYDTRNTDKVR